MIGKKASVHTPVWKWTGALGLIAVLLAFGGYSYYRHEVNSIRESKYNDLKAISDLKANDLSAWREARLHDADMNSTGRIRTDSLKWLGDTGNSASRAAVLDDLRFFQDQEGYENMIIAGVDGSVLLSPDPGFTSLEPESKALAAQAVSTRGGVAGDFFRCAGCTEIHLDTAAPIMGADGLPVAVLLLRSDPAQYLYPLIESWPTPSESAETLLVRREGDHVLFLNSVRFLPGAALTEQVPLSKTNVAAVLAVQGTIGMYEGVDYRNVEVLADLRIVPGTPWFMVSKVDANEILAEARYRGLITLAFVSLLFIAVGILAAFLVISRRNSLYKSLFIAEREQRQTLEEFRATLRGIGDGVIATDAKGRVRQMNPVAEELTGWSETEAIGRPLSEVFAIINELSREVVENPVDQVLRDGMVVGLANHTLLIARDGAERPIADSGAPICDEAGSITGVALVFRDRSEEREAERVLLKSEQKYRSVLDYSPFGMHMYELKEDGRLVFVDANAAASEILGVDNRQFIGKTIEEAFPPLVETDVPAQYRRIAGSGGTWNDEQIEYRDDAINGAFEISAFQISQNRMAVFFVDVTVRKQAEESLRKALIRTEDEKEKSRAIIEGIGDGVSIQDKDFRVLFQNQVHKGIIGGHLGELCYEAYEKRDSVCEGCPVVMAFADGKVHLSERTVEFPDGTRYFEITASPIRNAEGKIIGGAEAVREITDRKRSEEERESLRVQLLQAQKMEAVGRLAGGVAHDFNNMLGVILGYAQLSIAETSAGENLHGNLQEIINAAQRSTDLTRQLLAFARRQNIDPRVLDLNDVTASLLNMLQRLIGEDIRLVWQPGVNLSLVKMDPAQVDQLLVNLAVNARDAIDGVGLMTVETENVTLDEAYCRDHTGFMPGHYAMIAVSDDGRGISSEDIDQIFEPFFTTKETGKGTGLGLATVYGIVKQNNGFINVYSEPGHGTTFRIYLPALQASETVLLPVREKLAIGGSETVLIVEDEEEIINISRAVLGKAGYTILSANNPTEALRLAAEYQDTIHLLVTDVIMPGMNGKDLRDRLVVLRPEIKVLFMSGYTADVIAQRGVLEAGVNFLQKPFSVNDLVARVREVLNGQA